MLAFNFKRKIQFLHVVQVMLLQAYYNKVYFNLYYFIIALIIYIEKVKFSSL